MLVLSRGLNQSIIIDGKIVVKICRIDGGIVKVGIDAPPEIAVHREEVFNAIQKKAKSSDTEAPSTPQASA